VRRSPHDREILRLALWPLGALAEPLYLLADTAIVGLKGLKTWGSAPNPSFDTLHGAGEQGCEARSR